MKRPETVVSIISVTVTILTDPFTATQNFKGTKEMLWDSKNKY